MRKLKMKVNNNKTFKEGFEEYILSCISRNLRDDTIRHYKQSYKQIIKYLDEDITIDNINKKTFENFIINAKKNNNMGSQTLYTYCRDLKTIINFFIEQGYIQYFKIELPRVDKLPIETYTDEELEKLLKKPNMKKCSFTDYRNYVMTCFFLSTGLRMSSVTNIKIKDINLNDELVNVMHTKNRKVLRVPLNKQIIKVLKEYLKYRQYKSIDDYLFCNCYGKQLNKSSTVQALGNYNKKCGVETTGIHRLRHTFAKKWILSGNSVVTLQKILGHSNLQMTQNYINILITDLNKEVNNYNILQEFNNGFIKLK